VADPTAGDARTAVMPTRREFLVLSGSAAVVLAGCGGSDGGGGGGDGATGTLSFTTWGSEAELAAFKQIIAAFERANPGAKVALREVPFEEVRQNVDAGLEAGKAPDLFRVTYQDIGFYSSQQALTDLTEYLPGGYADDFIPALWEAVNFEGKPYGVPQHTDVSALVYNKPMLARAGVRTVPDSLDNAWSWDEFLDVSRRVRDANPGKYGHAMNWQLAGAYRWLNWQWQAGGRLLSEDLTQPALDTPEGAKTLGFFRQWYEDELVPPNTNPKGKYPDEVFPAGTFGLLFTGDFLLPALQDTVKRFDFGAMPLPRDAGAPTDLGGNAVVVTRDAKDPELAAKFALHLASEDQMRAFCEITGSLPTRTALADAKLDFQVAGDLMPVFQRQATTLPPDLVKSVTLPGFTDINTVFTNELEALVGGQSVEETLAKMTQGVQDNLS
jgi:ABC-type glycerol-3-phosphate transport system substrate-binding protein